MFVHTKNLPVISNVLDVMSVWMEEKPMEKGRTYDIKRATSVVSGSFEDIDYKVDVNTYEKLEVNELGLNDIAACKVVLTRPIASDAYESNRLTGSFIVVDRISNDTVGAGMILGAHSDNVSSSTAKEYTQAEKALNAYIRANFPEWECREV